MARRPNNGDYASAFGQALDRQLTKRGLAQVDIASATGASPSYINRLMTGRKVSPEWADKVCNALRLEGAERSTLHAAAAVTFGFKLDLTPKALDKDNNKKASR